MWSIHIMEYNSATNRNEVLIHATMDFLGGLVVKNLPANAGDVREADLIPSLGRSPGIGNGNPLQYSCLENSMDRGAWGAIQSMESQRVRQDCVHAHFYCHMACGTWIP